MVVAAMVMAIAWRLGDGMAIALGSGDGDGDICTKPDEVLSPSQTGNDSVPFDERF